MSDATDIYHPSVMQNGEEIEHGAFPDDQA